MEKADSLEARGHIACPPRRNAAKDEHSGDRSVTARTCARCKIQSDHWPEVLSAGARTHTPKPPTSASPSASHYRPDVREVNANSAGSVCWCRSPRHTSDPAQI